MGIVFLRLGRPWQLVVAWLASMGLCGLSSCGGSAPPPRPAAPYVFPVDRAPGAAWLHGRETASASVVPRRAHALPIVHEIVDADGHIAIAVSADGHVSMRDLGTGATRASFSLNESPLETAVVHIAEDGRRALVGTLGANHTVNRMVLWDLVADRRTTLIDAVRDWEEHGRRFAAIHADPKLTSIFVAELEPDDRDDGVERTRIRVFDGHGVRRCASEPVVRRDGANAIAAIDSSALFLARVGGVAAQRIDSTDCSVYPLRAVDSVLATRPNGDQMVTRDVDGSHSLRRPVDGARLAPIPDTDPNERFFYDPHGVCLAMVDPSNRVSVLRPDDFRAVVTERHVEGEVLGIEPACGAIILERAGATVRHDLESGTELRFLQRDQTIAPALVGASESHVHEAVYVPSRASVLVIAAAGVVEWTSAGPRVTACGGGSQPVLDAHGAVRLVSARGYCDVARDRWVERPVHATSDDGTLALVGGATGNGERTLAYVTDLRDDSMRGPLPEIELDSAAPDAAFFSADGSLVVVQQRDGPLRFYSSIDGSLRGRHAVPLGRRLEVLGRTADGVGFVLASTDDATGQEDVVWVDPRHPDQELPYDASASMSPPPPRSALRLVPVECRDGTLTIPADTTDAAQALGDCRRIATEGADARGIVTNGGRLAIVVDEETTHLIGLGVSGHVTLRASFAMAPEVGIMPFAIDETGHASVERTQAHDAFVRRAGDARNARLDDPSARERIDALRLLARLLAAPSGPG